VEGTVDTNYDCRLFCVLCKRLVAVVEVREGSSVGARRVFRRCQCQYWPDAHSVEKWRECLYQEQVVLQKQVVIFA